MRQLGCRDCEALTSGDCGKHGPPVTYALGHDPHAAAREHADKLAASPREPAPPPADLEQLVKQLREWSDYPKRTYGLAPRSVEGELMRKAADAIEAARSQQARIAQEQENELVAFRRLSDALTGGNAATWDEVFHAAEAAEAAQARLTTELEELQAQNERFRRRLQTLEQAEELRLAAEAALARLTTERDKWQALALGSNEAHQQTKAELAALDADRLRLRAELNERAARMTQIADDLHRHWPVQHRVLAIIGQIRSQAMFILAALSASSPAAPQEQKKEPEDLCGLEG